MFPVKPMPEINNSDLHAPESRKQTASQKFISFAFGKIVSLWPADTRDWALAMQAELPQMESTQESLHWLAGGIMSLGKAWWNGATSSDNKKELPPVKKPGILAALVTVAALALLLIPSAHHGLRAVVASWQPNYEATERNQLLKIAQKAESSGDAKTLAFVGMRISSRDQSVSFCNKAVALDPSLTWIFSQGFYSTSWVPQARDWGAKLEAWDPGNAVAFIIEAQARAAELNPKVNDYAVWPQEKIESDPQWLDDGRKALESPRFDSYRNRRLALDRDVIRALGIKDPIMIGSDGLRAGWIDDWPVRVYSNQLLKDAKAAAERGDKQTAKREAWAVAHFGELMRAHGATEIDRRSGVSFLRPSYTILQPLLAAEGRRDEAAMLAGELEATKPGAAGSGAMYSPWTEAAFARLRDASIVLHLSAACSVFFASALLVAGLWLLAGTYSVGLRSGRFYRVECYLARYSPAGLLLSLAALAVTYSPIADAVSSYLDQPISNRTTMSLLEVYFSVSYVPEQLVYSNHAPYYPVFWMIIMALGALTIATIIGRNILNRAMRLKAA
jgi:hypothetical protein